MFVRGLLAACVAFAGAAWGGTPAVAAPEMVTFSGGYYPGTIIVNTRERRLYYVLGGGTAIRYKPLGVTCGDCHDPRRGGRAASEILFGAKELEKP